jgi:NCS1 family nucleobase:cation symporter-1
LIVDYWLLRKTELDLRSLYVTDGRYRYTNGWNIPAAVATIAGAAIALAGAFWEPLHWLYNWSWFVGFGIAGGLYYGMMQGRVNRSGSSGDGVS